MKAELDAAIADAEALRNEIAARLAARPCDPLVKWAGGKAKLLPEILKRMPPRFNRYIEPFAGGAALFFYLARPGSILGDSNADLMAMYRMVAEYQTAVTGHLQALEDKHRAGSCYYETRDGWNFGPEIWTKTQRAAAFLYLNRTCYNGLWRTNRKGEMNVSEGRYKNPTICDPERILACSKVLAQAKILMTGRFPLSMSDARPGDFVFADSPYVPVSPTSSFSSYTVGGFHELDHEHLAALARDLVSRGTFVMLCNSDTPLVRKLYRGFKIERVKSRRSINCHGTKRGEVNEVIITGGYDLPKRVRS